ncbi:MAG: pyridoxamine 5'-phosphate oxidase family protein [Steroidobacteraceae bacterium]
MTPGSHDRAAHINRLLAGAANAIATVRSCWLVTAAAGGAWRARPMGRLQCDLEADDWRLRFVADGRSRKAREIHGAGSVTATFQQGDDAFVALAGVPAVRCDAAEARLLLKKSFDVYFPTEQHRANAAVIEIDVRELDLWIRGVTPEPFGLQPTRLERDAGRMWRVVSDCS